MEPVRPAMPAPPPAPSPPRPAHGPRSPRAGTPRPVPVVTALPTQTPLLSGRVGPVSLKESCEMPGCPSGRTEWRPRC
ncbi:myb-related transcription factor, partner of profilin-like [Poecile atricapillus]|uniref:myb-related transcription factor, partner of profilin-like n=1 Tax=Poecile atricapillus TaxID=48891 RepID=UPI002739CDBE|nr:myb-related transcription factor, partner of profilin-like [Poecile atricapillus]